MQIRETRASVVKVNDLTVTRILSMFMTGGTHSLDQIIELRMYRIMSLASIIIYILMSPSSRHLGIASMLLVMKRHAISRKF